MKELSHETEDIKVINKEYLIQKYIVKRKKEKNSSKKVGKYHH